MKEKRLVLLFAILFVALISVNVSAATVLNETAQAAQVDKAYSWLSSKVTAWPSGDDGAFTLMALAYDGILGQKGKDALMAASKNSGECWPSSGCNVKSTALAISALNLLGADTLKAETWLMSRKKSYSDPLAQWHLQIDTSDASRCTVEYNERIYGFNISKTKEIGQPSAGTCLTKSTYGFQVSSSCLDKTFLIKCESDFYVSMIYTKGSILYVPGNTKTGSANSYVDGKIETVCLADGSTCSYEGTAWAAYVLSQKGRDVSMLIPYLIGFANDNLLKLPDAFLYMATADTTYSDKLLSTQHPNGYWFLTADKVYDTSIAILALKDYNPDAKTKAMNYILSVQGTDGSFGSIGKTSLVLYAFWPKTVAPAAPTTNECESRGYYCRDKCESGEEEETDYNIACGLRKCCGEKAAQQTCTSEGYQCCDKCAYGHQTNFDSTCFAGKQCCSQCETEQSCSDLGGSICDTGETCSVTPQRTPDGDCCTGTCAEAEKTCADLDGVVCDTGSCTGRFEYGSDGRCCVGGECKKTNLTWLIVVLSVAVVGVVIFFLQKKGIIKFGKKEGKKPSVPPAGMPVQRTVSARPVVRPLLPWPQPQPQFQRPQPAQPQPQKPKRTDEFEETFKKLKEM